jgi:type IX secretion system PorP/SprF family membrane protein
VRFSELNSYDPEDNLLQNDIDNRFSPNIGAGVYYHTDQFYLGVSVPRMLETEHFDSSNLATATERMHLYFITGYVYEANRNLKFKPALLTKAVKGAPLQVDMSLNFMLRDRFVLGAAYRWDAAVSGLAGFHIGNGMFLGLAYDREVTELGNTAFNDGSFEVVLRYDFIDKSSRFLKSPRFF